ncbi:MAG: hypothetical protein L0Y58_21000, partial [Verrucomicrobia subdivision 3 bacterium]|nr:hypothetical protein [Limisphaerales bacterium]
QFIQLRSRNVSFRRIAEQLDICVNTARKWEQEHKEQIDHLRAVHLEAIQERYLKTYEHKLADLTDELDRIDAELKLREFECVSTEFLLYRKTCLQARLEKLAVSPAPLQRPANFGTEPQSDTKVIQK